MKFQILDDSKNYTGVVVKLTNPFPLHGLDNLVGVYVFGNTCIIPKSYDLNKLYIFFPSETVLSKDYLSQNNIYRNSNLNDDMVSKGYFEENGRIKAIKFKGNKSTGFVMPIQSLDVLGIDSSYINDGVEFNTINGINICKKYVVPSNSSNISREKLTRILDEIIDSKLFPEHIDTSHLLRNIDRLNLLDYIVISIKLHGTSARTGYTQVKRKLSFVEKVAKFLGAEIKTEEYKYVVGSRRVVKSIDFQTLNNKNHFYAAGDIWTRVAKEHLKGKLHKGEMVYYEIIGKFNGAEIQRGYSYMYEEPKVFVYRITHLNEQGIEIDLEWNQVATRCKELGLETVPVIYRGSLNKYLYSNIGKSDLEPGTFTEELQALFENHLRSHYIDQPSILDYKVVEEGICVRVEKYPHPETYKFKSPEFLIHEGKMADALVVDMESQSSA
jgi:hypothetical protein